MKKYGFSWKRATGVTKMKRKVAKITGVPMTKQGRKRKAAHVLSGGCLILVLRTVVITGAVLFLLVKLL